ncbi:uncharacterized protein LOC110350079 [Heterocephalus glaber]|uniref:Uncharacterized protein LOC110350079 n=1 Tax=Heterocephalus glaber TaxID=10181 RepID=A0AAX6T9B7_HETGA|nr:uncharacterized protein LOC110350079 [Heterocephalus glaber]
MVPDDNTGLKLRLLSRARPVTDQQPLRSARRSPNPRAQVDSAGPRPALSAGPTPPRLPGRSPVPTAGAGRERVQNHRHPGRLPPERSELSTRPAGIYLGESASESKRRPRPLWRKTIIRAERGGGYGSSSVSSVRGTCRAGGRPAEKTNRCFFFLLLLLLPHRNTHKHPTRGPSYRGGIATGPGTNPPVGGGVPPCGLVVSEQNADRKCSCRNDSLRRRQTLTTTPSSPLHFRHRRRRCRCRRRHSGSRLGRAAPYRTRAGPGRRSRDSSSHSTASSRRPRRVDFAERRLRRDSKAGSPRAFFSSRPTAAGPEFGGGRVREGPQAQGASLAADGGGRRPRSAPLLAVISFRELGFGPPRRGR